ncbi:MAG: hypothetical protein H7Y42_08850 [Chitinophagaceae bacterium]|nr:hypothetical protein [Chitinophagaceae bacterium]
MDITILKYMFLIIGLFLATVALINEHIAAGIVATGFIVSFALLEAAHLKSK